MKSSSNHRPKVSRPTNAPTSAKAETAAKQHVASSPSILPQALVPAPGVAALPIEDKIELLAHVLTLERLAKPPEAGIKHEMCHHGAQKGTIERVAIRHV